MSKVKRDENGMIMPIKTTYPAPPRVTVQVA